MIGTYHYLSGLPRSGNTVLSAILNQHPDIHSSALSPVCEYMWVLHNSFNVQENTRRNIDKSGSLSIFSNLLENHYAAIDKPIVFDREKNWGSPANLGMLKYYVTPTPKIIYTVRPIVEILASFITLYAKSEFIEKEMASKGWDYKHYLTLDDNRCDFLMRPWGGIETELLFVNELKKSENKDVFHIIEYDDLINKPQEVMNDVYNFVGIESFSHNFTNIIKVEKDYEKLIGMPETTHKIRPILKKTSPKPESILSDYVISKYSNMEFWRK